MQSPEKFKAYLDVKSRMDRYTANNALLMYKQFPQASQIKEFDDWAADGVNVNKGSKTFIILDPYEYTKKDGTVGIDFNLKRVLDVSPVSYTHLDVYKRQHICCFFVKAQYQRQGIGRKLWNFLRENSSSKTITVNS